jgi:RNA polymerase sigma-70 factor (ECF subfamily)
VTLHRGGLPEADSVSLAAQLLGKLTTPSQAAIKAETRLFVQEALNSMDPLDREVLALKHFEQLSTSEIAAVLGLSKAGPAAVICGPSTVSARSWNSSRASGNSSA